MIVIFTQLELQVLNVNWFMLAARLVRALFVIYQFDSGVLTVNYHKLNGGLSILFARPAVTLPVTEYYRP